MAASIFLFLKIVKKEYFFFMISKHLANSFFELIFLLCFLLDHRGLARAG